MQRKVNIQHYQYHLLEHVFETNDIPVKTILYRMCQVLPPKYHPEVGKVTMDKDTLKKEIIEGGSYLYERLITALERKPRFEGDSPSYPSLAKHLDSHGVHQLYRYMWVWSDDGHIMTQGKSWFTNKESCLNQGRYVQPNYTTFDGPGAPSAELCIEAVCPCHVFLTDTDITSDECLNFCNCQHFMIMHR